MRAFLERHRHSSLLVAVLLSQLFFLAYQIKSDNDVRLIRRWAVAVIGPVERGVRAGINGADSLLEEYITLYNARQESQLLRAELERARLRLHELKTRADESDELAALLELKQSYPQAPLVAARVIAASPAAATRTVLIDRGADRGVQPHMAVLTPEGVVGKVVAVFPTTAQVLLITDRKSGVGVRVADSPLAGVVKGTGGTHCQLDYVPNEETLAPGTELYTSGQDQLFPPGLPVGRIISVGPGEIFLEAAVEPAAPLAQLDHVLVLAGPPETLGTAARGAETSDRPAPPPAGLAR
jgi:rod shape-determining protein MreC